MEGESRGDDTVAGAGSEPGGTQGRRTILPPADPRERRPGELDGLQPDASRQRTEDQQQQQSGDADMSLALEDNRSSGAAYNLHDEIKRHLDIELSRICSSEVLKHIKKCSLKLCSKIESLQSTNEKIKALKKDIDTYERKALPEGQKFSLAYESELLDKTLIAEDVGSAPRGTSLREAKRLNFISAKSAQAKLDLQYYETLRLDLKSYCKYDSFLSRCIASQESQLHRYEELDLDFDGEISGSLCITDDKLKAKIKVCYGQILDKVVTAKTAKALERERADKAKKDVVNKLTERKPEEWLCNVMDSRIRAMAKAEAKTKAKMKNASAPVSESIDGFQVNTTAIWQSGDFSREVIAKNVQPSPKNDPSPSAGGAQSKRNVKPNAKARAIAKAKDKPPAHPKGKGKGKGKGKDKGKGKGKPNANASPSGARKPKPDGKGSKGKNSFGKASGKGKAGWWTSAPNSSRR